jgi:hypothetical protein
MTSHGERLPVRFLPLRHHPEGVEADRRDRNPRRRWPYWPVGILKL